MLPEELLQEMYVTMPALDISSSPAGVTIRNRVLGTRVEGPHELVRILEFFQRPALLSRLFEEATPEAVPRATIDVEQVQMLLESAMITELSLLMSATAAPAMGQSLSLRDLCTSAEEAEVMVFGAPTDLATTGDSGARRGPTMIRHAFAEYPWLHPPGVSELLPGNAPSTRETCLLDLDMRRKYVAPQPRVVDVGNLRIVPGESIDTFGARVRMVAGLALSMGARPFLLGGDHSVTHFVLQELLERHPRLGIIHFDAHHDTASPLGARFRLVTHGNPFQVALESDRLEVLLQIGLRTMELVSSSTLYTDSRVRYVSSREAQRTAPEALFRELPRDIPYYLTFDIDCISPDLAPETGTPVAGGLSYYQAIDLVDFAARELDLVGYDIVEVGGSPGQLVGGAARVAGRIALQLLLGHTRFEPLTTYLQRG